MDAIDFSSYLANDCRSLSLLMFDGRERGLRYWNKHTIFYAKINDSVGAKKDGLYHDKTHGNFEKKPISSACFCRFLPEVG
jgi:hypothetical protein